IDSINVSLRKVVHLSFAGQTTRDTRSAPCADVTEVISAEAYEVVSLDALVRAKLNSFQRKDRVHLRDLLEVGLIDSSCLPNLGPENAERLRQIIDDPDG
ncbi:MAG TPA: hypothetical protein VGM98_06600, partial [Schlesneria sp.]